MLQKNPTQQHIRGAKIFKTYWVSVRRYRWWAVLIIFSMVLVGILEVITPLFYKRFFDVLTSTEDKGAVVESLTYIIFIVLALNALAWVASRVAVFINNFFQSNMMADLRHQAFSYMINHSYAFFANNFTGSLVQRVGRFARAFVRLSDRIIWNIIPLFVRIVGVFFVLWFVSQGIALILLVWVVLFLAFNYFFSIWKLKYHIERAAADSRTTGVLSDAITNQNTIQLFGGAHREIANFKLVTKDQARITKFTWDVDAIAEGVQAVLIIIAEFFLFYYAIRFWDQGLITIGTFVLIQAYLIGFVSRLWDFARVIRDFYEGMADAKEMVEILDMEHEVKDIPNAKKLIAKEGRITFRDVSFYFYKETSVIHNLNIEIKSGEKVALIGPSGAGKSTIVRLLLRFYDVISGEIKIDGTDIRDVTQESLRRQLSLVPQDPILFHRTLMENIRYGKKDATKEEVKKAARLAHCDEFIEALPQKYETYVGERGIKLSGGERQRVAIARAILKNAPVLILDEATSSLDSHSESLIQDALSTLMERKTTIVIAHRLSTIRKMDRIIVIDRGKILEEGSHGELIKKEEGLYRKLWSLQAGGFLPNT